MSAPRRPAHARLLAGAAAAAALLALALETRSVMAGRGLGLAAAMASLLRYFTILTTVLAAGVAARAALGRPPGALTSSGALLAALVVAAVYHVLLAPVWEPAGLNWWSAQASHTLAPLLLLVWWIAAAPKAPLGPAAPLVWLAWPLAYFVYALTIGLTTGWYAYPFLDPAALGWARGARNVALFLAVYGLAGALLRFVAGRLARRHSASPG